jgi:hypothetical protein
VQRIRVGARKTRNPLAITRTWSAREKLLPHLVRGFAHELGVERIQFCPHDRRSVLLSTRNLGSEARMCVIPVMPPLVPPQSEAAGKGHQGRTPLVEHVAHHFAGEWCGHLDDQGLGYVHTREPMPTLPSVSR